MLQSTTYSSRKRKEKMSFKPTFKVTCYQDVKTNLTWYASLLTLLFIILFGILFFHYSTNPAEKIKKAERLLKLFEVSWVFVISYLLIVFCEIHDKVYDRFFVRWRYHYDIDFILPRLTQPLANKLSSSFYIQAQQNKYEFMKPFYVFVGDGDGELRISSNLRVRFYERILKYWMTQINEILLLCSYVTIVIATIKKSTNPGVLLITTLVVFGLFIFNRMLAYIFRNSVRQTTIDEIEEIHDKFLPQLNDELEKLHEKYGINYGQI